MGVVAWVILGLVAGVIARSIVPGPHRLGCLGTAAVGVAGGMIGGAIASAADVGEIGTFYDAGTWGMAIVGSVLLLLVLRAIGGRSRN